MGSLLLETHRAAELDQQVAALAGRIERVTRLVERLAAFVGFTVSRRAAPPSHP